VSPFSINISVCEFFLSSLLFLFYGRYVTISNTFSRRWGLNWNIAEMARADLSAAIPVQFKEAEIYSCH
jgi:hypothetical protein